MAEISDEDLDVGMTEGEEEAARRSVRDLSVSMDSERANRARAQASSPELLKETEEEIVD